MQAKQPLERTGPAGIVVAGRDRRYRQVEQDEEFYEEPRVTLDRLRQLEAAAIREVAALGKMLCAAGGPTGGIRAMIAAGTEQV